MLLAATTGCSALKLQTPKVWPFADDKPGSPTSVVALWTDTVKYQPNQLPQRGFGGRLMFYEKNKKDPVKVEGTLVVYAFEERSGVSDKVRPDRKYVFTKEQLARHYSESKIGHSYSVWLPWDVAGGGQKEISLIVRFMPEKGNVVVSDQSKNLLPGATPATGGLAKNDSPAALSQTVPAAAPGNFANPWSTTATTFPPPQMDPSSAAQWASYQTSLGAAAPSVPVLSAGGGQPQQMTTATINLPTGLHLQSSPIPAYSPPPPRQPATPAASSPSTPEVEKKAVAQSGLMGSASWGNLPLNRFSPGPLPAPGASIAPPGRGRGTWAPNPAGMPSVPASAPSPSAPTA